LLYSLGVREREELVSEDVGRVEKIREREEDRAYLGAVYVVAVATVLIVSAFDDTINGLSAWALVTLLTVGYMIGSGLERGLARRY
jgi:hypothetical protein